MLVKIITEPRKYISKKIATDIRESFGRITRTETTEALKQMQFPIDLASCNKCKAVQRYGQLSIAIDYPVEYNYPEERLKADCDQVFDWALKKLMPTSYYKYSGMLKVGLSVRIADRYAAGASKRTDYIR